MKLYEYQKNVLRAIESDPSYSQLISMPTGTGKTITFLAAAFQQKKNCLIIVHRQELLQQTCDKAILVGFQKEEVSVITSEDKGDIKRLTIAMVATLSRNLDKYNPSEIQMMVIDEAHHASAASYQNIISHFKMKEEHKLLLGFTATPLRGDKKQLSHTFESHSFKMTLSEATQQGYICPVHGLRIDIDKSLSEIDQVQGDYDIKQLENVMNCEEINNLISDKCQYLQKTPAIIFCTSVNHAIQIAKKIREKKRKAISISYKTPLRTLNQIFKMFKERRIDFITNVTKLSEGFDHPSIETVILARPTRSPVLYKQMIGRGLRKSPNKFDCQVLEFSGNDDKMMRWEDIDENCTFHSTSIEENKSREEAIKVYKAIFNNSNIIVKDVRISPFKFYECYVIRKGKFRKDFIYIPFSRGFTIFKLSPGKANSNDHGWKGFNLYCWMAFWKVKYQSFYIWSHCALWTCPTGLLTHEIQSRIDFFCESNHQGRWYPSEEEPITTYQKRILKADVNINSRKAEMMIEDAYIKRAIYKFWVPNCVKLNGCMELDILSKDF